MEGKDPPRTQDALAEPGPGLQSATSQRSLHQVGKQTGRGLQRTEMEPM